MATMKDVADRAGVSLSTVSYVLSGSRSISEPTRARIYQAMDELHFQPNAIARALASKRTRVVALLLSPESRGLGLLELEFVKGASEAAKDRHHHLVLLTEGPDAEADLTFLRRQGLVEGVIVMDVRPHDPRLDVLQRLGLPFSLLGTPDPPLAVSSADIDFDRSFQLILGHLSGLGHRRVALVNQSRDGGDTPDGPGLRAQTAFDRWGKTLGLETVTASSGLTPRDGQAVTHALFEGPRVPTGLVVMNDRALPGVLQALVGRGLTVPDDVSVVSAMTSATAAEMVVPALTSADAPGAELARLAVNHLIDALEDPQAPVDRALIPCLLTLRGSTGPAP